MKCINKKIVWICLLTFCSLILGGCTKSELKLPYQLQENGLLQTTTSNATMTPFAESLCVGGTENMGDPLIDMSQAEGAGLFCLEDKAILYAKNIYNRLYPASTTKILTAVVALKYGNLQDPVTISENALRLEPGATTCGFGAGDVLTMEQLLYGLMLNSGNDAAIAIAEHISGSVEAFVELMNTEAAKIGATQSHFVNPNGLHDENHYSTVYDLYLICNEAVKYEKFMEIISQPSYTAQYQEAGGGQGELTFTSTNQYYKGEEAPEQVTILGGKTGTTNEAGSCLVLCSQDRNNKRYISIILKAEDRDTLYVKMNHLLNQIP